MTAKPMVSIFFSSVLMTAPTYLQILLRICGNKNKSPFCKFNKMIKVFNYQRFKRKFTGWFSLFLTWNWNRKKVHLTLLSTAVGAFITLIDFTLSNVRGFYSSMGNPLAVKGLRRKVVWLIFVLTFQVITWCNNGEKDQPCCASTHFKAGQRK